MQFISTVRRDTVFAFLVTGIPIEAASPPQQTSGIPESVEAYSRSLAAFRSGASPHSALEDLLELGRRAGSALVGPDGVLERLSESDYATVNAKMSGFLVGRRENTHVVPDADFFLDLARKRDEKASVEFFETYRRAAPGGIWKVYITPQTDYSGCIRFGSLSLVDSYGHWTDYRQKFPGRYRDLVAELIRDIETQLVEGICACEGKEAVLRELTAFVRAFPASPIAQRVRDRIGQVERGMSNFRFKCISG